MAYKDKEDQKRAAADHYNSNKDLMKKRAKEFTKAARARNKKYIEDYLSSHPCIDCGEQDIIVLDFDHVSGDKVTNVSTASNGAWSLERIQEEINKCEVRCANCHRRITHKRRLRDGLEVGTSQVS